MNHYVSAAWSAYSKISGELLLSFDIQPKQILFADQKNEGKAVIIKLYKQATGEFIISKGTASEPPRLLGFKSLLNALFFFPELSQSGRYFELLDQHGELTPSKNLILATIGEYKPSDLKVLYIQTKDSDENEECDCAVLSNTEQFLYCDGKNGGFSLSRKENTIQVISYDEEPVDIQITQTSIYESLWKLLTLAATRTSPRNFHIVSRALMQAIGELKISAPHSIEFDLTKLDLQSAEVIIGGEESFDELDSYICHTGIDGENVKSFKIYGTLVAQTAYQNMNYSLYASNNKYVLVEQSATMLNQKFHAYTRAFRFNGFNHNCQSAVLELNLPVAVCLALQEQMGLPSDTIVHGLLSTKDTTPLISIVYVGKGEEIKVIGMPFTFHTNQYAKVSTYLSENNINLLIALKELSKPELNTLRDAFSLHFSVLDFENMERVANFKESPYICISSESDVDFFAILSHVFNPLYVQEEDQGLLAANMNALFSFIEDRNLLPPKPIYIS